MYITPNENVGISIIVPVYNAERYLKKCIDSVLEQTFDNFELLLIDDGSTDSSGRICNEYALKDPKIKVYHKKNGGVSSARNFGIGKAKGEWVTFLDSDDWLAKDFLEKCLKVAQKENADIVFADFYFVEIADSVLKTKVCKTYNWGEQRIEGLRGYLRSTWTILCGGIQKIELYEGLETFCPKGVKYCEDFHLIVRLVDKARKVAKVNEPLYYYRQLTTSTCHTLNIVTQQQELWVYEDIIDYFRKKGKLYNYKREMAWRVLKATQDWALREEDVEKFIKYNYKNRRYIISCPYLGFKLKVIGLMHTYGPEWMGLLAIRTRNKILGWMQRS